MAPAAAAAAAPYLRAATAIGQGSGGATAGPGGKQQSQKTAMPAKKQATRGAAGRGTRSSGAMTGRGGRKSAAARVRAGRGENKAAATPPTRITNCANCHAAGRVDDIDSSESKNLKLCPKCSSVAYCNSKCRAAHRDIHIKECWRLARDRKRHGASNNSVGKPAGSADTTEEKTDIEGGNGLEEVVSSEPALEELEKENNESQQRRIANNIGAFGALAQDDDDDDDDEEEEQVLVAKARIQAPSKTAKKTKPAKSKSDTAYGKLGKALAMPSQTATTKNNFHPKTIPKPAKPARTSLGERPPDLDTLRQAMRQEIVLHHNPRQSEGPANFMAMFTGVYEPLPRMEDRDGFPAFVNNPDKTRRLCQKLAACSPEAKRELLLRGIFLQAPESTQPFYLERERANDGRFRWFAIMQDEDEEDTEHKTYLFSGTQWRPRELDFWTDQEALFRYDKDAFTSWAAYPFSAFVAMTPLKAFMRTISLAEIPSESLRPWRASDFSYWNKPLVVHADPRRDCQLPRPTIDRWMGVYVPIQDKVYDGYPVWQLHRDRSNVVAGMASRKAVRESLAEHGIVLNHGDADGPPAFLYMYNHVLHIASKPNAQFSLRGETISPYEEKLMTESDSLFSLGEKAFVRWAMYGGRHLVDLDVAVSPEEHFVEAIKLAELEVDLMASEASEGAGTKSKKRKKKKRNNKLESTKPENDDKKSANLSEDRNSVRGKDLSTDLCGANVDAQHEAVKGVDDMGSSDSEGRCARTELAQRHCYELAKKLGLEVPSGVDQASLIDLDSTRIDVVVRTLFGINGNYEPPFLFLDDSVVSSTFEALLRENSSVVEDETKEWLRSRLDVLLINSIKKGLKRFCISILSCDFSVCAKTLIEVFGQLPECHSNEYNNAIAKAVTSVSVSSKDEVAQLKDAINNRIGKRTKKDFLNTLKQAETSMLTMVQGMNNSRSGCMDHDCNDDTSKTDSQEVTKNGLKNDKDAQYQMKEDGLQTRETEEMRHRLDRALEWYLALLRRYRDESRLEGGSMTDHDNESGVVCDEIFVEDTQAEYIAEDAALLSSDEVAAALAKCLSLSEKQQTEVVCNVEKYMDLSNWDDESTWVVDITEQAHKWFRKHLKKQRGLCERVIRRLKLLSTGRWPYVLCKPLAAKPASVNLYESKIDSGSRIIWEVAVAFSPRRSVAEHNYCEQVIRVWDIVQSHDNLSRAIDLTVERIEKSYMRGQECMIYSELEGFDSKNSRQIVSDSSSIQLPRVFPMRQGADYRSNDVPSQSSRDEQSARHYPPANDDPRQFTLLKFYELDAGAIKLLLSDQGENADLPFTPGPKEHEIIHFKTDPHRSILLMGRSGTGKTTCLVFRLFAQYMAYIGQGVKPRQIFVTKNDVLRREVEKSFQNMGLAWKRKSGSSDYTPGDVGTPSEANSPSVKFPIFLVASEWIEILDSLLPGERFFTPREIEERASNRQEDDVVKRGLEALFAEDERLNGKESRESIRREMTYTMFRKKWHKINSRVKSNMDSAQVWLEIKSFIKGSVDSLRVDDEGRALPKNRFLTRAEYLALPRKVSRIDESQRQSVYDLYKAYEKVKKEGNYYDEMDIVYCLAGRVSLFWDELATRNEQGSPEGLLPIDSLYVDEVQDFTQAELYLLTKLSSDPNNLMLAGDTAQSIAVGVGFRFTDVRQIFYNHFGGNEPKLLQLIHNYRSHAGVLHLAACVVELLYFFFSDSLDKLPPDLGLFTGPKPVIMKAESPEELVLMLDGTKRETSRIEFGAHQVVIVRSNEAKQSLPDEFGIDKDWVMTVQESKGLEFDDVLLYNFFTDSEAKDLWRVVSNYTEADISAYYEGQKMMPSGVQNYDWDSLVEVKTRRLDFCREEHKILETEFKMLYTAITRARVNVFIAETDTELSRPMFEYFTKRRVVEEARTDKSTGIEGVRVFGKMSSIGDWRKRGSYYLNSAEGQRRKGCLRLAAKCFDKAGEYEKREYCLAFLAFLEEMEEEQDNRRTKKRDKQGGRRQRLYQIAIQLLEAKDIEFLDKAALCLLEVGDQERIRSAEMFELYANILYAKRNCPGNAPSRLEQQYFSYAAKLFERCAALQHLPASQKREFFIRALRNYLTSASQSDLVHAAKLLEANAAHLQKSFRELISLCAPSSPMGLQYDPIVYFQSEACHSETSECIWTAMKKLARIACRTYHADNDIVGLKSALGSIHSRAERIQVLSSLERDPVLFIAQRPWASHAVFSNLSEDTGQLKTGHKSNPVDATAMLVEELCADGKHERAAEILEERGLLLQAADLCDHVAAEASTDSSRNKTRIKAAELRLRYMELVLACGEWEKHRSKLSAILESLRTCYEGNNTMSALSELNVFIALMDVKFSGASTWRALDMCSKSLFLWRYDGIMMAISRKASFGSLLAERSDSDVWSVAWFITQSAHMLQRAASALYRSASSRKTEDKTMVAEVESYYHLQPYKYDPNLLSTHPVTNLKLREAFQAEEDDMLNVPVSTNKIVLKLSRDRVHSVLTKHLYRKASKLLLRLDAFLAEQVIKTHPCDAARFGLKCKEGTKCKYAHNSLMQSTIDHILMLQAHVLCLEHMDKIRRSIERLFPDWSLGKKLKKRSKGGRNSHSDLVKYLLVTPALRFAVEPDDKRSKKREGSDRAIAWRFSTMDTLAKFARDHWDHLSISDKKSNFSEFWKLWRLLQFCDRENKARHSIDGMLARVEKKKNLLKEDLEKNKRDHFLDMEVENLKDIKLFPRLFIYAIDNVNDDLFKSMAIVETLLKRTTGLDGLRTPSKLDQISLLEVNAVGVFSAISLRYSHAPNAKPCLLIPEKSYLQCYIKDGSSRHFQGFGVPLQDAMAAACHENFFHCFSKCVGHVEFLAGAIVKSHLLRLPSKPSPDDIGRFERAIVLSSFICCNAAALAIAGADMNPTEAQDDPHAFPSLPVCGKIRELVKLLKGVTLQCDASTRLQKVFARMGPNSTFLDLMKATDLLLQQSWFSDNLVLCRLKQVDKGTVEVETVGDTSKITSVLEGVPFQDKHEIFSAQNKRKNQQFLDILEHHTEGDTVQDISAFSRKSDERNAAMMISRFWRSVSKRQPPEGKANPTYSYFRTWKQTMCRFVLMAKRRLQVKLEMAANARKTHFEQDFLSNIPNFWCDSHFFQGTVNKWRQAYLPYSPVFDGIECGYCSIVFDRFNYQQRHEWCHANCPRMTYKDGATSFNLLHYNSLEAPFGMGVYGLQSFGQHVYESHHQYSLARYNAYYETLTHAAADLEFSFMTINNIIQVCDLHQELSWYLNIGEEARQLYAELESCHYRLVHEGLAWPPITPFDVLMATLGACCRNVQSFFERVRNDEHHMMQSPLEDEELATEEVQEELVHPLADFQLVG